MNIVQVIKNETAECRDKTVVVEKDIRLSNKELLERVDCLAEDLAGLGVQAGSRIAFLCDDSADYIIISLAVLSLDAVIVPISASLSLDEVSAVIQRIQVHFFIFDRAVLDDTNASPVVTSALCSRKLGFSLIEGSDTPLPREYHALNPAFIRFSSGTTGLSKGVILSHKAIIERTDAADKGLKITSDDRIAWVLSMSFHFVVSILLFLRRGAMIILCGDNFPENLRKAFSDFNITFIYATPFHYRLMCQLGDFTPEMMKNIRMAVSTAIGLPESLAVAFRRKFSISLSQAYGIIEVGLPFINTELDSHRSSSVGRILPDYSVCIQDPDENGCGSVLLQGKGMFDAYYSPFQKREEWFDTGDIGYLDSEGYLFLVSRKKNVINFTGMKIFPQEVESVLNSYAGIRESYVYGQFHEQFGQVPVADIVLSEGYEEFSIENLQRFCYENLSSYKVPKEFNIVRNLPKTASGKIKRYKKGHKKS